MTSLSSPPMLVKPHTKMIPLAPHLTRFGSQLECLISSLTCLEDTSSSHSPSCMTTMLSVSPQPPTSMRRQRVAFDLTRNVTHEAVASHANKDLQWYRQADYAVIKYRASCLAAHILHDDKRSKKIPYEKVLQDTMQRCEKAASTIASEREDVLQNPLSRKERARLEKWLSVAPSRSGLEHWLVPARFESNRQRRSDLLRKIRSLSGRSKQDYIRELSEAMSRPHRLYALAVAEAEASAVAAQNPIQQQ